MLCITDSVYANFTGFLSDIESRRPTRWELATIGYKCLHGLAPPYLAHDGVAVGVTTVASRRQSMSRCSRINTTLGTRNFAVASPLVWNSLSANIRSRSVSLQTFAGRLKTYLFELPYN